MKSFIGFLLAGLLSITTLTSCFIVGDPDDSGGGGNAVDILNNSFNPATLNVATGTEVTWTHRGSVTHNVTRTSGTPDSSSGNMSSGDTFSVTYTQAGDWEYECTIHAGMTGTVHVTD